MKKRFGVFGVVRLFLKPEAGFLWGPWDSPKTTGYFMGEKER
jgi:hypothetical protein